jgi:hypothetical protein
MDHLDTIYRWRGRCDFSFRSVSDIVTSKLEATSRCLGEAEPAHGQAVQVMDFCYSASKREPVLWIHR